jgi:7-cyano-7-deazaguanine reductase
MTSPDPLDSLNLLGRSEHRLPASPDEARLEVFPNRKPERPYTIHLSAPDFASLCPVTGQPDAAHVEILYVPDQLCVETKSLKFYLASYRNHAAFNESIVNRILDDLVAACAPRQAIVRGRFVPRGGIQLTCEARHPVRDTVLEWPAASLSTRS